MERFDAKNCREKSRNNYYAIIIIIVITNPLYYGNAASDTCVTERRPQKRSSAAKIGDRPLPGDEGAVLHVEYSGNVGCNWRFSS